MISSRAYSRLIDLLVLTFSFLLFTMITNIGNLESFATNLIFYVSVMFIMLRLCKRIVFERYHTSTRMAKVLLGNTTGLVLGALLMMLINQFLAGIIESSLIIIIPSIFAFFILGTLSPMVKSTKRDILHH